MQKGYQKNGSRLFLFQLNRYIAWVNKREDNERDPLAPTIEMTKKATAGGRRRRSGKGTRLKGESTQFKSEETQFKYASKK